MSESVADLIAEVAAEHIDEGHGWCAICPGERMPCPPARLAAALSVENVAAGLRTDSYWTERDAAALLAAMKAP